MSRHLPEIEREARAALEKARNQFRSWAVAERGSDLLFMNVNSTAQIQQLLFAPGWAVPPN